MKQGRLPKINESHKFETSGPCDTKESAVTQPWKFAKAIVQQWIFGVGWQILRLIWWFNKGYCGERVSLQDIHCMNTNYYFCHSHYHQWQPMLIPVYLIQPLQSCNTSNTKDSLCGKIWLLNSEDGVKGNYWGWGCGRRDPVVDLGEVRGGGGAVAPTFCRQQCIFHIIHGWAKLCS